MDTDQERAANLQALIDLGQNNRIDANAEMISELSNKK